MNPIENIETTVRWLFVAIFVVRAGIKLNGLRNTDVPPAVRNEAIAFHVTCMAAILAAVAFDLLGVAVLVAVGIFSVKGEHLLSRVPFMAPFAAASQQVIDHFRNNWSLAQQHFEERGIRQFSWFTKDPVLKRWKQEAFRVIQRNANALARPSVAITILGIALQTLLQVLPSTPHVYHIVEVLKASIWNYSLQVVLAVVLTLFVYPLFLPLAVEQYLRFEHKYPKYVDLL